MSALVQLEPPQSERDLNGNPQEETPIFSQLDQSDLLHKCKQVLKTYIKEMISITWCVEYTGQCKEQCCQIMWSANTDIVSHPFCQYVQYLW